MENNHIDVFVFGFVDVLNWLANKYDEKRFSSFANVINTSMRQLLPYKNSMCGIAKEGFYPEVVQHTNWDYGKNGKGFYNNIFAPIAQGKIVGKITYNIDGIEYGYWGDGAIVETSKGAEVFYEFDSWYSDSELTNKVEGTDDEMQNMTLYAGYNFTGKIYYASDLEQINNSLLGQNFVLMNDIVVSNFDGIGDSDSAFNGQFNGNGFKISGLTTPLFKSLGSSAVVTNLLIDVNISSTENYAGAFCEILNGGIISNCRSTGSISSKYYSGGIAAVMNGGTIENCSTAVNIKSTTYAGGIVAVLKDGTISSCSFNGEIIANANSSSKCNIEESNYNERYFTGSYSEIQYIYTKYTYTYSCYIGGIVAQKEKGEIIDCSNSGSFVKNCSINTETKELTDKKSGSYPLIENGDKHTMSYTYFYYEIILGTKYVDTGKTRYS